MQSANGFEIYFAYGAEVPPCKNLEKDVIINSKLLSASDNGMNHLLEIFDKAMNDCKIEIMFDTPNQDQKNEFREKLIEMITSDNKREQIADEFSKLLAKVTDNRIKEGFFVILIGKKLETHRVVMLRFRGESAMVKRKNGISFNLDLIAEAYSEKSQHYKAAVFEDIPSTRTFWLGFLQDRQSKSQRDKDTSIYWIKAFLTARYKMTDIQGTQQISKLIREFFKQVDTIEEKERVISAVHLLGFE